MNPKHSSPFARTLSILLGLFILFLGYKTIHAELTLRKYENAFLQVEHPQGTTRVDSFGLEADYYPATYVDDSVRFKSVYLVGELRSYRGDWSDIQAFYQDKILERGALKALSILSVPVELRSEEQKLLLPSANDFSYSPLDYDVLEELQNYYRAQGLPHKEAEAKFYLVYVTPDL
jgi:hypothetical protein